MSVVGLHDGCSGVTWDSGAKLRPCTRIIRHEDVKLSNNLQGRPYFSLEIVHVARDF
jgi:hypothetical protein